MKKRLLAVLLAGMMFTDSFVMSFAAEETTEAEEKKEALEGKSEDPVTGTQQREEDKEEDVDEDIRQQLDELIPDQIQTIEIATAEDLLDLADKCRLDTWSVNKRVVLTENITLLGKDFQGIPTFGGEFDGQGHTIEGFAISDSISYGGFFVYVQKTALIRNLNVEGAVTPSSNPIIIGGIAGDNYGIIRDCTFKGIVSGNDYIGGIAGINELSGNIMFCSSEGFVSGKHFTGGICGENMGNIANCQNEMLVNTTNTDTQITVDSMETLNKVLNLMKNGTDDDDEARQDVTVSDTGGIAGLSIGIITRSINNGDIGYEHVGYNVGGIAGRQSGYILGCSNNGKVQGRKDVGGIVGQAEPYITVDLSTDIAYQLSENIAKLHDTVTATLNDAKNQSDVITARLAVIQKFTAGAVDDTRFIATGTVDFVNGVTDAANSVISRVDYVIDEASKKGGMMDQAASAAKNASISTKNIAKTVRDLNLEQYLKDGEKDEYDQAVNALESVTSQYNANYETAYKPYYNEYLHKNGSGDLKFSVSGGDIIDRDPSVSAAAEIEAQSGKTLYSGKWIHYISESEQKDFPLEGDSEPAEADKALNVEAKAYAADKAKQYAEEKFQTPEGYEGYTSMEAVSADASKKLLDLIYRHLPEMTKAARADAEKAAGAIEDASDDLYGATDSARKIAGTLSGYDDIAVPSLSADYKAHTASLADNMQGMNDNFGILNQEVNGATGVLVDDLRDISNQFNNILELYTDAIDGVLEKDYTTVFSDTSYEEAAYTTDATVDSCFNFGVCEGDISVSGIAGTMAVEYDFDMESQITGIKDANLNSSFLTKCVLRNNRNYGSATSQKDYAGGICGRQEMGTILNCGSYGAIGSTSGDYVGGVAGASLSYIVHSYGKGELEGRSYIGGIAGDGKNIKDSVSLVDIKSTGNWFGAIAGHVDEKGEVRSNFFVSDDLAGIDRVSYSLKAEPINYSRLKNIEDIPYEFNALTVTYILEDEDLEGGKEKIAVVNKNYGDSLEESEYPGVKNKDGYYVSWDITKIDSLKTDATITAQYNKYRTTISGDEPDESINQSDILVDGRFKEGEKLTVERELREFKSKKADLPMRMNVIHVIIPDDGSKTHQIRFRPVDGLVDVVTKVGKYTGEKVILYQVVDDERVELTPTGEVGKYTTYEIEGNDITLVSEYEGMWTILGGILAIAVIILIIVVVIIVVTIVMIKKHGRQAPRIFRRFVKTVSDKIESKETIFYDDSAEEKKQEQTQEEKKEENEDGNGDEKELSQEDKNNE